MSSPTDLQTVNDSLEQVAEKLGDITPLVLDVFYRRHPDAHKTFLYLGEEKKGELEGMMVEHVLYILMSYLESPIEIDIMFQYTVPHHDEFLDTPIELYVGFIQSVVEVILSALAETDRVAIDCWQRIEKEVTELANQNQRQRA